MKQSRSTMKSVPTGIGEDKDYVFMSDSLQDSIGINEVKNESENGKITSLNLDDKLVNFSIISIELENESSYILRIPPASHRDRLMRSLLNDVSIKILVLGEEFNSKVFKIESDTCYLRLTR